jgi:MFS family permease
VPAGGRVERKNESWRSGLIEGVQHAAKEPVIMGILVLLAVQSAFGMPYQQVFVPWLAIEVMGLGAEGAGYLMAVAGVGSFAGAVAIATMGQRLRKRGLIIIMGLAFYGVALAVLGLTSVMPLTMVAGFAIPAVPVLMIILAGLGQSAIMSIKNALLLENTPNALRGRIMSLQSLDRGFTTVGSAMGGFLIALIGGPLGLAVYGGLCAIGATAVGALMPALRKRE